ncbi:hypothetical protein EC973_002795 [Apophysomyces ossiformis]|uniref:Xylanolytic transcriptional activator regulatory domain-containing protein n=1 Tax=Apophysomyces ossiformis TaxID=679940 RepID=A0A8H7BU17_9FUNG|nr:hypothetical protein EC973_002795 [Apophysomyces ossiformis]
MEKMLYPGASGTSSNTNPPKTTTPTTSDDLIKRKRERETSIADLPSISHNGGPHSVSPTTSFSSHSFPSPSTNVSPHPVANNQVKRDLLPPMDVIEHLVQVFFDFLYASSPIFDRTTLMRDIRENRCSEFLILSILALSARYSDRSDIKENPPWHSGEKYASKARDLLIQAVDEPSIPNVQALLLLGLHEYGCARGPRSWMYAGMAIRMALELGLNKEIDMEDDLGETQPAERWIEQEFRRRLFWNIFCIDKLTSASTGRPSFLQEEDIDIFLPSDEDGWTRGQFYTETLDRSRIVHFNVRSLRDSNLLGVSASVSSVSNGARRAQLSCSAHHMRLVSLLGKVTTYINRGSKKKDLLASFDANSDFSKLDREIEDWYEQLPLHMKNTPANFERYRAHTTMDASRYAMAHMLHNALIVLLHRPSLVLSESLTSDVVPTNLKEFINHSVQKCLAAVDNVTMLLKAINSTNDLTPPFMAYVSYTVATIVVNNTFSSNPTEAMHAKAALNEHFRLLESMRPHWAMADKLYFMIRDLYAMHTNVLRKHSVAQSEQSDNDQGRLTPDKSSMSDWPLTYSQDQVSTPVSAQSSNGGLTNIPIDQRPSNPFQQSSFDQQSTSSMHPMQPMASMTNIATIRKMSLADLALSTCDGASTTNWMSGGNGTNLPATIQSINRTAGTSQQQMFDFHAGGGMLSSNNSTNLQSGNFSWNDGGFSTMFFKQGQAFPTSSAESSNENGNRIA